MLCRETVCTSSSRVSSTTRLASAARLPSIWASTSMSTFGLSACSEAACQYVLPHRSTSAVEREVGKGEREGEKKGEEGERERERDREREGWGR